VSALLALGVGAWVGRSVRGGVADQFLVKHADRIVPVAAYTPGPAVIDVSDAASLHRVAERFDTVVLHHAGPTEDVFVVRDLDATYRLVVPGGLPRPRRSKPPVPAARTPRRIVRGPKPAVRASRPGPMVSRERVSQEQAPAEPALAEPASELVPEATDSDLTTPLPRVFAPNPGGLWGFATT
jgi:hypothetical protein